VLVPRQRIVVLDPEMPLRLSRQSGEFVICGLQSTVYGCPPENLSDGQEYLRCTGRYVVARSVYD